MRVLYEADIGRQSLATVVGRVAHEVPDREQSFFRALSEGTWRERAHRCAALPGEPAEVAGQPLHNRSRHTPHRPLRAAAPLETAACGGLRSRVTLARV